MRCPATLSWVRVVQSGLHQQIGSPHKISHTLRFKLVNNRTAGEVSRVWCIMGKVVADEWPTNQKLISIRLKTDVERTETPIDSRLKTSCVCLCMSDCNDVCYRIVIFLTIFSSVFVNKITWLLFLFRRSNGNCTSNVDEGEFVVHLVKIKKYVSFLLLKEFIPACYFCFLSLLQHLFSRH